METGVRKRPELPTDGEPKTALRNPPIARFSEFPYDLLARYINNKVEFTVGKYHVLEPTPWEVRKLT